jgi:hypothetical protein
MAFIFAIFNFSLKSSLNFNNFVCQFLIMENQGNKPDSEDFKNSKGESYGAFAKYTSVAFQMMAIIGASAFVGYKIDQYYNHKVQYATAIACVLGVFLSIYQTIRQLKA